MVNFSQVVSEMLGGFRDVFVAPFKDLSVFWLIAPVMLLWIVMEFYFDTHKKEKLGWNTALGNGVSMFWITIGLMKYIFSEGMTNFAWTKFLAVIAILLYAVFIAVISFQHYFSAGITYALASPTAVYYLSVVAVLWGYGSLSLTAWVLLDLVLLLGFVFLIERIIRHFVKESGKDEAGTDDSFGGGKDSFGSGSGDPFSTGGGSSDPFGSGAAPGQSDPFAGSGKTGF